MALKNKIKIIVADDHKIFRDSLCEVLSNDPDFEILDKAENGIELLKKLGNKKKPDVIIMDISMPEMDGIEATHHINKNFPDIKIIALSMHSEQEAYQKMLQAGIKGFVLKKNGLEELKYAIEEVSRGKFYFSDDLIKEILANYSHSNKDDESKLANLSKREIEILKMICSGLSNGEISEKLFISPRTVDTHKQNLLAKTNSKNIVGLVVFAIKNKLFQI